MIVQFIIPLRHQLTSNQQSVHSQSFALRRTAQFAQEYYESETVSRSSGVTGYSGFSGAHTGIRRKSLSLAGGLSAPQQRGAFTAVGT
jgi:hypothetical protein